MSCKLSKSMKKSEVRFDKEFEVEGTWWLPENQDNKVSGKLSYLVSGGIKLEVFNKFQDFPKVVHGTLTYGLQVSLIGCYPENTLLIISNFNIPKKFDISMAFFGKHFNEKKISELNFKKMNLHFTFLDWFRDHGAEFDQMNINNSNNLKFTYQYAIKIEEIKTEILYSQTLKPPNGKNITHNNKSSLSIIPKTKASFDWFLKVISDLTNFLSLVSDVRNQHTQVLFYTNDNDYVSFLHQLSFPVDKKELNNIRIKMIQFAPIKDKLEDILQLWFKKSNELRPVFDLFFSVVMHPNLYEQSKFIHLSQALEIFHRKTDPFEKEFKKFKDIVTKDIENLTFDEKFKKSVLWKLDSCNKTILSNRLKKVILPLEENLKEQLINPFREGDKKTGNEEKDDKRKDEEEFVNDVVNIRNNLTHHNPYNDSPPKRKALHHYTEKLFILLSYLILVEVGFPKDLVSKNFRNELTL